MRVSDEIAYESAAASIKEFDKRTVGRLKIKQHEHFLPFGGSMCREKVHGVMNGR